MKQLLVITASFMIVAGACTSAIRSPGLMVKKRQAQYGANELPQGWHKKSFRGADLYFEHQSGGASIFLNAQCEKLSDSPLEALTAQLLVGMGKYHITQEQRIMLNQREALVSEITVNIDGVSRFLKVMVLKKNACVFDAVFNAPKPSELVRDFDALVQSFWAEANL